MSRIGFSTACALIAFAGVALGACSNGYSSELVIVPSVGACELKLGTSKGTLPSSFHFETAANAGESVNSASGRICDNSIDAEVFVHEDIIVAIFVTEVGACFDSICIGENYEDVRARRPNLELLLSAESGGVFALRTGFGISYVMSKRGLPLECFEPGRCPNLINSALVEKISIYDDTA